MLKLFGTDWLRKMGAIVRLQERKLLGKKKDIITRSELLLPWGLMSESLGSDIHISYLFKIGVQNDTFYKNNEEGFENIGDYKKVLRFSSKT